MGNTYETILKRASVRKFTDKEISKEDLKTILNAGIHAPTGMNRQTWKFYVLSKKSDIHEFAAAVGKAVGRDESYDMYNPAALVIATNDTESPWGAVDCACALENIFLSAADLGIGSCWINQATGNSNEPLIRKMLTKYGVPTNYSVYGMAALGYPDGPVIPKEKNPDVVTFID